MPDTDRDFKEFFERATDGHEPYPYQTRLATSADLPALVDVPTGLGKTVAAVLAWLWRRRFEPKKAVRDQTPRRLVYCLPMRVLVEQTYRETTKWLKNLDLYADAERESVSWAKPVGDHGEYPIAIHLLLGGEGRSDWALWPERDSILIGTQDMLLSRALNRGYAAGRARWPLEFGLLNNDCLWVFDEIQLMDTGLASSLQLDAWRQSLPLRPSPSDFLVPTQNHGSRPCHSLWMSATMARHWLERAVDWEPRVETAWNKRRQLSERERTDQRLRSAQLFKIEKQLFQEPTVVLEKPKTKEKRDAERKQTEYLERLAACVGKSAAQTDSGLTLVILNTVDRATGLFRLLRENLNLAQVTIKLIHSRFRPLEREQWGEFLDQRDQSPRILVSTQVVEAGVDLSARVLYTELAPWASLVQRFGRCARYPRESGTVFWLDLDLGTPKQSVDHWARPYERSELVAAREQLRMLADVGLKSLTTIKVKIDKKPAGEQANTLLRYEPRFVPRDKDLVDLFDTTPDLTGADVDISRFIRDGPELDIQVFWRDVPAGERPLRKDQPQRCELCPVPFYRFRDALPALRRAGRIWRRNYCKGWETVDSGDAHKIYPGQIFLLEKSCGGYSPELGWTGETRYTDFDLPEPVEPTKATAQDNEEEADDLSHINAWLTVLEHTSDVCRKLDEVLKFVAIPETDQGLLRLAARWHDCGKAHPAFQTKLKPEMFTADSVRQRLAGQPAAKAPDHAWLKNGSRRGFRHELASALAIFEALYRTQPAHKAFAWPDGLNKADFDASFAELPAGDSVGDPLVQELAALSADELDLLVYLAAAHHGKVRMSLRSSSDDDRTDVPDPCPVEKRQARGVRDGDTLPACQIPTMDLKTGIATPAVTVSLDLMELGLSPRYGASWRERMQMLLETRGPFRLAYLEGLLRAADCRASIEEDQRGTPKGRGA